MTTSETLLGLLRGPGQPGAWNQFVSLYSPVIYAWLKSKNLSDADAADLMQDIFSVLVVKLPQFEYDRDRSFRCWLRTITLNIWRNHCRQWAKREKPVENLSEVPERTDFFSEDEYRRQLTAQALEMIRPEFKATTWQAFISHGIDGRPAAEVAEELGTSIGAVYASRCRVVGRLRVYLQGLLD